MNTTNILKKLPPQALAAPLLNAAFSRDASEMDRVLECVPRRAVLCPDPAYIHTREFLEGRLLMLAAEYWRSVAFASNVNAAILANPDRPAREVFELDAEFQAWKSWARMLDCLLTNMAEIAGLDEAATRQFLSLPDPDPTPLTAEEEGQLAERISEFQKSLGEAGRGV